MAKKPQALEAAPQIEEALVARLEEAGWLEVADAVHNELTVAGNVLLRIEYEEKFRNCPRLQPELNEEALEALINTGVDPAVAWYDAAEEDDEGNKKIYLGWEKVRVHAGVTFRVIPWEDMIVLPATARDPDEAFAFGERLMIRGWDLQRGVKEGKYIKEAVDDLLEHGSGEQPVDRSEKLDMQGTMSINGARNKDALRNDYLCYDVAWQMDANNDGELEWVMVTLAYHTNTVLSVQYLPYEHGCAPFVLFRYLTRPRELWGMSIPEKLAGIQDAATAVLNQLIDANDLHLAFSGNWFYDGTSGFNPDKFVAQLGRPIRVDSIEGVKPFDLQPLPTEAYHIYQLFKDSAELLTASSNPSLGKATDTQKTLGEVQIVSAAAGMMFEEIASRVARDWAKVWDQVRWLEAQYAENGEVQYRKTAAPAGIDFGVISKETLLQDVDLQPAALRQLSDMQSRVQQSTVVQNTLLQHPLLQMIGPDASAEIMVTLLDNFLQSVSYPQREKVMGLIRQALQAMQAVQQMELEAQAQQAEAEQQQQQGMVPGQPQGVPPGTAFPEAAQLPVPPGLPQQGLI